MPNSLVSLHTVLQQAILITHFSCALWLTGLMLTPAQQPTALAVMLSPVAVGIAQGFLIPSVHTVLFQVFLLSVSWIVSVHKSL